MGVAPRQGASTYALDITHGDVHTARETLYAVDDAELAVVAVVHLAGEGRKLDRHEDAHVDASTAHTLEEPVRHPPTSHIVIDNAHLDALACLLYQGIRNQPAQRVVGKDVHIEVYMMPGTAYSLKQCREELVAIGIKLYLVVLEGQCKALVGEQLYKRAVPIG